MTDLTSGNCLYIFVGKQTTIHPQIILHHKASDRPWGLRYSALTQTRGLCNVATQRPISLLVPFTKPNLRAMMSGNFWRTFFFLYKIYHVVLKLCIIVKYRFDYHIQILKSTKINSRNFRHIAFVILCNLGGILHLKLPMQTSVFERWK